MRTSLKFGIAIVAASALTFSACGGSDTASSGRTKNAALSPSPGLNVKSYTYDYKTLTGWETHPTGVGLEDQIIRDDSKYTPCANGVTSISNIDAAPLKQITDACKTTQYLLVHYTGFITAPGAAGKTVSVKFSVTKDNTFSMKIGDKSVIDVWKNSPCATVEGTIEMSAGWQYPLDAWFNQYSGGLCNQMSWSIDGGALEVVPTSALSREAISQSSTTAPVPTTAAPTTTAPATTTSVEKLITKQVVTTTIAKSTTTVAKAPASTSTTVADQAASGNAVSATTTTIAAAATGSSAQANSSSATTVSSDEAVANEASDTTVAASDSSVAPASDESVPAELATSDDEDGDSDGSSSNWLIWVLVVLVLGGGGYAASRKKKK